MAQWEKIAAVSEVPAGGGRCFESGGRKIAVFNIDGSFHAIDNVCLHRGGPLADGELRGTTVVCPWHGWQYDVRTGKSLVSESVQLKRYPLEARGDELYVDLSE